MVHELEEKIMDCWGVCEDINVVWTEHADGDMPMTDDELANVLLGMQQLYSLKFARLWRDFEAILEHGGVWLTKEQVALAKENFSKNMNNHDKFPMPSPKEDTLDY
jgi:hypothetical protein